MNVISLKSINQTFKLKMEGETYNFRLLYNKRAATWTMDVSTEDGVAVASGIALKLGTTPLKFLRLRVGDIMAYDTSNTGTEADYNNLNGIVLFIQLEEAEIA